MEKLNPSLNYNYNSNLSIEEFHSNLYANTSAKTTKNNRTIYDPVHGHLELEDYAWEIIDTPEFQRLRNLFQLGNCNYVFPGATHTRFEHSIGVGYLSNRLASHLVESVNKNKSFRSSNINTDFNLKCATLAGLLHDLGHGPFSHLFDRKVIKTLDPNIHWEHEDGSVTMFDYLIDNNNIDIENYEKVFIQRLIKGEITACDNSEYFYEPWIFEIVANKKNSIDVDKFDYICRDAYHIGLESSFVDYERIFKTSKIINNTLCYNVKNDFNLFFLFQSRHKLFKQIYRHKKVVAVDLMVKDMLILSNDYFKFTEAIFNPEEYVKLDDGIIHQIEKFKNSSNPNLTKAYKIVNRLRNRDIYGFVGEFIIQKDIECIIKLEDIITYDNPKDQYHLTLDDLEIVEITNDYGNKDKNPFDSIFFYKDENPNQSYTIPSSKISMLVPSIFRETSVALYCKDENKRQRAYQVFEKYKKQLIRNSHSVNLPNTLIPTPEKNNKFTNMKREASQDLQEILKNTI